MVQIKPTWYNNIYWNQDRNGMEVMLFVAIVDGKIPIVHAFIDHTGVCQWCMLSWSFEGSCVASFPNHGNTKAALVDAGRCSTIKVPHFFPLEKCLVFVSSQPLTVFSEVTKCFTFNDTPCTLHTLYPPHPVPHILHTQHFKTATHHSPHPPYNHTSFC